MLPPRPTSNSPPPQHLCPTFTINTHRSLGSATLHHCPLCLPFQNTNKRLALRPETERRHEDRCPYPCPRKVKWVVSLENDWKQQGTMLQQGNTSLNHLNQALTCTFQTKRTENWMYSTKCVYASIFSVKKMGWDFGQRSVVINA